jgi:hypothetical protein
LRANGEAVNVWQQQKLDDLRRVLAAHLERRALATDIDALRRIDGEIAEHVTAIAEIERKLKATP